MPRFLRQFGLRSLLLFCTLAAVCFGVWRWHMSWVDRQFELAEQIGEANGTVGWQTWGPSWLHETFGSHYFSYVISVDWHHKRIKDEQLALLRELSMLEYLYVAGNRMITDEGMQVIDHLPHLRVMAIWGTPLTDKTMVRIGKLKGLEVLDFHRTKVTEDGLKHLRSSPSIVKLIHSLSLTDAGLDHLASIPNVEPTELSCIRVTDRGIEIICDRFKVTQLSLSNPQGEQWAEILNNHPTLQRLSVSDGAMTDEQFSHFLRNEQLFELSLTNVPVTDDGLVALSNVNPNFHLNLQGTKVTIPGLMSRCGPEVDYLTLTRYHRTFPAELRLAVAMGGPSVIWRGPLGQDDFHHFQHGRRLEFVEITAHVQNVYNVRGGNRRTRSADAPLETPPFGLDDEALKSMASLPTLTSLRVSGPQNFSAEGIRSLAEANVLHHLHLSKMHLRDEDLVSLALATKLRSLNVSSTPITSEGLKHLVGLKNLVELNISYCRKLDSEAGRSIAQLRNLKSLTAVFSSIGDEGLKHLHGMPKLAEIYVYGNGISPAAVQKLMASLPVNASPTPPAIPNGQPALVPMNPN
ncbi:hypothetical protein [Blastopirellula marina]|uniref:Leucine Rich repeats (2 copies) n=1 Tax=Blastopirellula marina TaxID=124 RepID=A0A2S8GLJ8_9BACT|nr:hypothetical protein [Blastopirellula marina]PQO45290.1 hypothetical protein C5Y93_15155 [Blastopirellula marina]